jgi:hypothetical protein
VFITALAVLAVAHTVAAQGKVDVVTLANGDRLTGEIVRLERGRLEFETADAGTLQLEWDKLLSVIASTRLVEVVTSDGRRFLGTLVQTPTGRSVAVAATDAVVTLPMADVTFITPIGRSFWKMLDGSFDAGFSYTASSGITQLNVNAEVVLRRPAFEGRFAVSATQTEQDDDESGEESESTSDDDDRSAVQLSYLRFPWRRWFLLIAGRFETNASLGLELRSQFVGAVGPYLINSNRAQMSVGAGIGINDERGVDVESTRNIEAVLLFQTSFYRFDRPKTNVDVSLQYFPSLSDPGRQRVQFDAGLRRELLPDFMVSLNGFNTFDSDPPNASADTNDVGIVWSIGWSY